MTAPDPRLDEIQARLSAATPGPWESHQDTVRIGFEELEPLSVAKRVRKPGVTAMHYVAPWVNEEGDQKFIANAPTDIAYLLAELRKAREALTDAGAKALEEAADAVAAQRDATNPDRTPDEAWSVIDHRDGRFFGKTVAVRLLRARAKALRAAVAAAKGDEQ